MPHNPLTSESIPRPPVIAVMGHIDHGKSTLLDYIRKTNVTEKESGGITQHLSAYELLHTTPAGKEGRLTFLDTPGHEAFGALRARGAKTADIAILVVSAEEGVKPQTLDALSVINQEKIPFVVALNKIDKPEANVEKTKASLAENNIYIEGYGGTIPAVAISAKTGEGVDELLDMVILLADLQELKGNPQKNAEGVVLENKLDSKKGISATLVIKDGVLKSGMIVVAEQSVSSVRIFEDFLGTPIKEAHFSSPVRIIGWNMLPPVGAIFHSFESRREAEEYAEKHQEVELKKEKDSEDPRTILPVIIEADASGSLEALVQKIDSISNDRARFKIIHAGVGTVSEGDIKLAQAHPNSLVLGFHTKVDPLGDDLAKRSNITINTFTVIYDLLNFIEKSLQEKTPKITVEEMMGRLKVLKTFSVEKNRQIIGGRVEEGEINPGKEVKILRRGVAIGEGSLREVQKLKNKVGSAAVGEECGLLVDSKIEIASGDVLEIFAMVEK